MIKFVDGKGWIWITKSALIPRVGEYVEFPMGMQACVTRVMTVYGVETSWTMVTVKF
jgi:hypothetical protein